MGYSLQAHIQSAACLSVLVPWVSGIHPIKSFIALRELVIAGYCINSMDRKLVFFLCIDWLSTTWATDLRQKAHLSHFDGIAFQFRILRHSRAMHLSPNRQSCSTCGFRFMSITAENNGRQYILRSTPRRKELEISSNLTIRRVRK